MVPNCAYGIDLGTSNIKIYSLSDDSVMMEKNMIAIENKKNIISKSTRATAQQLNSMGNFFI